MGVCRVLGLVGSASCLAYLCFFLVDDGIPNTPAEWLAVVSLALLGFNFVPLPKRISNVIWKDSLISLWIEAKKSKLRKDINDD
jgi:hypothetical protein